ncbi:MAG: hypothetical protein R3319_05555 [Candidatus Bathyarchaeia archaeon]|nr:hypothetical protein [Candidatus Bathyarchaeia archaeon]
MTKCNIPSTFIGIWGKMRTQLATALTIIIVIVPRALKENMREIVEKYCDKSAINTETAKLVKIGLPKQHVERRLKEVLEERKC